MQQTDLSGIWQIVESIRAKHFHFNGWFTGWLIHKQKCLSSAKKLCDVTEEGDCTDIQENELCSEVKLLSRVRLFTIPWTVAYEAPLSMEFSRQEYWSGQPFPSPGGLPDPGMESRSPALRADALPSELPGKYGTVIRIKKNSPGNCYCICRLTLVMPSHCTFIWTLP